MNSSKIPWLAKIVGRKVAIVVAHQDDEAIGFCSVLLQCPEALMIHVTDGAPADNGEWKSFATREAYAAARKHEAHAALGAADHTGCRIALGLMDSTAADQLVQLTRKLTSIFESNETSVVFTHAYEGGHPDHDAVAFAVHIAARRLALFVIEAPFYRSGEGRTLWQHFAPFVGDEVEVPLSLWERTTKVAMLAAHASQSGACAKVSEEKEWFRIAPLYDFRKPPNGGALSRNYARVGLDAPRWRELVESALTDL